MVSWVWLLVACGVGALAGFVLAALMEASRR